MKFTALLTLALALSVTLPVRAAETDLPFEKLPVAVQTAMKKLVGDGRMTKTTRETEKDGTVLYEVAYERTGRKFEAEVSEAGKTIVVDEQISLADAPAAVRKTVETATAGSRVEKIEKATKGKEIFYEAEFRQGSGEHEVKIAPDGKLISKE